MSERLPKGWTRVKFPQILSIKGGSQPPKKTFIYRPKKGYVRLLQIRDFGGKPFPTYIPESPKLRYVSRNELLLARYGGTSKDDSLGRICTGMEGAYNVALVKLIFNKKYLITNFIKYLFGAHFFLDIVSKNSRSCQTGFNKDDLENVIFPLPPLNEQKRIVAKLDAVMPRIAAVKERLGKIPAILKRFRQSVLNAALSGKLTEKWRGDHSEIECVENVLSVVGDKLSSDYLNVFEETQAESLPAKWIYVPLENLGKIQGGGTPSKSEPNYWAGTIPWISPKDMKVDKIYSGKDFISNAALEKTSVKLIPEGSILFVVRGMILAHTFPVALTMNEVTINQDMKGITPFDVVDSSYLFLVFKNIQSGVLSYIKEATHGTLRLEMSIIKTFAVPLPPIEEQKEIVRQVDKLFALADKVEAHYQKARGRVDKLSQSILAKAFRGELVRQDPNDESAEKLLERIRQEKVLMERELKESRTRRIRKKAVKKTSRSIK